MSGTERLERNHYFSPTSRVSDAKVATRRAQFYSHLRRYRILQQEFFDLTSLKQKSS